MGKIADMVRRHAAATAIGGALLLTGVGFGAAAAAGGPGTREVADTSTTTTTAAPTPTAPTDVPAAGDTSEASIDAVTPDEPAAAVEPAPEAPVPTDAPQVPTSDLPVAEQSFGGQPPSPASMPKLPDEVGYVGPDGAVAPPA